MFFISSSFISILREKNLNKNFLHHEILEFFWTMAPIFILLLLAFPSLQVLYMVEETYSRLINIKITGHQWYWSYEYENLRLNFDSFINNSIFRLLDVDKALILPFWCHIRLLITSDDVIHSWRLPSLGIKIDANPGRLNTCSIFRFRSGWFYGQCSEICGINHSFMPVKLEFISVHGFLDWVRGNKD